VQITGREFPVEIQIGRTLKRTAAQLHGEACERQTTNQITRLRKIWSFSLHGEQTPLTAQKTSTPAPSVTAAAGTYDSN
jgi:hypothetical protein